MLFVNRIDYIEDGKRKRKAKNYISKTVFLILHMLYPLCQDGNVALKWNAILLQFLGFLLQLMMIWEQFLY